MPRYWLAGTTLKKLLVDRENDFALDGFREREFSRTLQIKPGDRLVHYVRGQKAFAAITEARHTCFLDWTPIWRDDVYPCRLETHPLLVLPPERMLPATAVISQLNLGVRPKGGPHQALSLRCDLTEISQQDYQLLETEMRRLTEGAANA